MIKVTIDLDKYQMHELYQLYSENLISIDEITQSYAFSRMPEWKQKQVLTALISMRENDQQASV